jgi:hypothetical protein
MDIRTGEVKPWDQVTPDERKSGDWLKLPPLPKPERPLTPAGTASLVRAEEKRQRRSIRNLRDELRELGADADAVVVEPDARAVEGASPGDVLRALRECSR